MISFQNRLTQYTLLSSSFLAAHSANADVVYTDVNPDITLTEFNSEISIDMDHNGVDDFTFKNWNKDLTMYNSYMEPRAYLDLFVQWVGPAVEGLNRIAGETSFHYLYNVGVFVYYYPYAMQSGDLISPELNFYPNHYLQSMAKKAYTASDDTPRFYGSAGYWAPGVDEKFLAVYFADADELMHYGWIRCSIIDTAAGIIIHDYAYEDSPETPIIAGATFSDNSIVDNATYTLYAYNSILFIYLNTDTVRNMHVDVYDLQGKLVHEQELSQHFSQIPLDLPSAAYIARIRKGPIQQYAIKFFL